jgi:hypothetical protein
MTPFGMRREYISRPTYVPEYEHIIRCVQPEDYVVKRNVEDIIRPHDLLSEWYYNYQHYCLGHLVSKARSKAVHKIAVDTYYDPQEVDTEKMDRVQHKLENGEGPPWLEGGYAWKKVDVPIDIPTGSFMSAAERKVWLQEASETIKNETGEVIDLTKLDVVTDERERAALPFRVPGFYSRSIVEVIKHAYEHDSNNSFIHHQPYTQWVVKDRQRLFDETAKAVPLDPQPDPQEAPAPPVPPLPPTPPPPPPPATPNIPFNHTDYEQVYGEAYTSARHRKAYMDIQEYKHQAHNTPGHYLVNCVLEWTMACMMIWSDSTCPYTFSNLKVWLIYLFLGNITKYMRCKPTAYAAHHIGYIPGVSNQNNTNANTCSRVVLATDLAGKFVDEASERESAFGRADEAASSAVVSSVLGGTSER